MADRSLKLRDLERILARYGATTESARGKGSHLMFFRRMREGVLGYPVPTHSKEVIVAYVRGIRRRFQLRPEDGVSDEEFYGKPKTRGQESDPFPQTPADEATRKKPKGREG